MNLIHCSNDCVFQIDGCCTLESPAKVTSSNVDCCHYLKKNENHNQNIYKTPSFEN